MWLRVTAERVGLGRRQVVQILSALVAGEMNLHADAETRGRRAGRIGKSGRQTQEVCER